MIEEGWSGQQDLKLLHPIDFIGPRSDISRKCAPRQPYATARVLTQETPAHWLPAVRKPIAAHFLKGAGLVCGHKSGDEDLVRSLAAEFQKIYEIGVEHGQRTPAEFVSINRRERAGSLVVSRGFTRPVPNRNDAMTRAKSVQENGE